MTKGSSGFIHRERARIFDLDLPPHSNKERAARGLELLNYYAQLLDGELDGDDCNLSDMLADFLHYVDTRGGIHYADVMNSALLHLDAERGDGDDIAQDTERYERESRGD